MSQPIYTAFGWHVIMVEDQRTRRPAEFDAVRDKFETFVARRAQLDLISKLRSATKVERLDRPEKADEATPTEK